MTQKDSLFLDCICGGQPHVARFDLYGDEIPRLYVTFYLGQSKVWWKRAIEAFKLLLKLAPSNGGHFDSWEIKPEDAPKLRGLLWRYAVKLNGAKRKEERAIGTSLVEACREEAEG